MFTSIREQLQTIAEYLISHGYDAVTVYDISVKPKTLSLTYTAQDDFQENIASSYHCYHGYQNIYADDLNEIWAQLYRLPTRAARELTVLANQLSGIAGMESRLRNVRVQQMLEPILASREEMKRLLTAPEVLEPLAVHLDDDMPF